LPREEIYAELLKLIPEQFHAQAYVAGGYAHNEEKAGDIDVWIVGQEDMEDAESQVRAHLIDLGHLAEHAPLVHEAGFSSEYDEHPHGFKVAYNGHHMLEVDGKFVQILVTRRTDHQDLLAHFDISTHMIARPLLFPTVFYANSAYFPLGHQPRVVRWDAPEQTLQRLEKICLRYGFEPHPDDVLKLVALRVTQLAQRAPEELVEI
jgi:hypothetical protein